MHPLPACSRACAGGWVCGGGRAPPGGVRHQGMAHGAGPWATASQRLHPQNISGGDPAKECVSVCVHVPNRKFAWLVTEGSLPLALAMTSWQNDEINFLPPVSMSWSG